MRQFQEFFLILCKKRGKIHKILGKQTFHTVFHAVQCADTVFSCSVKRAANDPPERCVDGGRRSSGLTHHRIANQFIHEKISFSKLILL